MNVPNFPTRFSGRIRDALVAVSALAHTFSWEKVRKIIGGWGAEGGDDGPWLRANPGMFHTRGPKLASA